jgi:fatty-acyl-CoA synthase
MHRVRNDLNMHEFTIAYGMTETSPISWQTAPSDPEWAQCETVGKVHPHLECMVRGHTPSPPPLPRYTCKGCCVGAWLYGYLVMCAGLATNAPSPFAW